MSHEHAVFAEYSLSLKPLQPGANTRVLNTVEVKSRGGITLDPGTGVVLLTAGTYHILATSIVTPYTEGDTEQITLQTKPYAGYCRLRYLDKAAREDLPIAIGTISNANMLPSTIDTFLEVEKRAAIVLDHQVGAHVEGLYLQVNVGGSSDHVFARMSIQRL